MPTVAIKSAGGQTAGEITLSDRVFGAPRNIPLMHQAVRAELENSRQDTRNVPGRGDMLGGGRKPYRQKGTGRARQGSIVSPHYRKGGAAHGPHMRDLGHSLPKKMRRAAILSALSSKLADDEMIIVEQIPLSNEISTKKAAAFLKEIGFSRKSLVIVEESGTNVFLSLRNIAGVTVRTAPSFSTRDVVDGGLVIITRAAVEKIEATWGGTLTGAVVTDGETDTGSEGDEDSSNA